VTDTMANGDGMAVAPPLCLRWPLEVPGGSKGRLMLGPGPANLSGRVREAMALPMLGHLHPEFVKIMDETKEGLRYLFQSTAPIVCCVSGTGHAGMEAMICNLLEPGEKLLIVEAGIWGQRVKDMAQRHGVEVEVVKVEPGKAVTVEQLRRPMEVHRPAMLFVVHVESSTGVLQPLEGLGELCRQHSTLLCVDSVAGAGGTPLLMDAWGVDALYTGSQKVLAAPPGLAPVALGPRAVAKLQQRATKPQSYYMDFLELANYWGCDDHPRRYHHTGMINMVYALREALSELSSESLEQCWERHARSVRRLHEGLRSLGLELYVEDEGLRSPTVTAVRVPQGVDWLAVNKQLMARYQVEISGGLGPTAGQIWRIGLMGANSTDANVDTVIAALREALYASKL